MCSSIEPRGAVACQGLRWQVDGDQLAADNPSRIRPARPANTRWARHVNLHGKWFWHRFREADAWLIAAKIDTRFLW